MGYPRQPLEKEGGRPLERRDRKNLFKNSPSYNSIFGVHLIPVLREPSPHLSRHNRISECRHPSFSILHEIECRRKGIRASERAGQAVMCKNATLVVPQTTLCGSSVVTAAGKNNPAHKDHMSRDNYLVTHRASKSNWSERRARAEGSRHRTRKQNNRLVVATRHRSGIQILERNELITR